MSEFNEEIVEKINYHSLAAIITFILLPPFWIISFPAILFSSEAKHFDLIGDKENARRFAEKSKRFTLSAWLFFIILLWLVIVIAVLKALGLI